MFPFFLSIVVLVCLTGLAPAQQPLQLELVKFYRDWVHSVAVSADGKHIITASGGSTLQVMLWEATGRKVLRTWWDEDGPKFNTLHHYGVSGVALRRRQARRHRVRGQDSDPVGGGQRQETPDLRQRQQSPGVSVALSGDGKHVVTGSGETAILWEAASGKKLQTFQGGHTDSLKRGPERRRQARRHRVTDKTAILWEAASGKKLQTFQGHTDEVIERGPERRRQARRHRVTGQDGDPVGGGQRQETPDLPGAHR